MWNISVVPKKCFVFSRVVTGHFLFSNQKKINNRERQWFLSVVKDKYYSHIWNQIEPRDYELKATSVAPGATTAGAATPVMQARGHDWLHFWLYRDVSVLSLLFFSTKLSKKYGPIYTIHMGPKKVVVLSGYETVKDALINYGNQFGERSQVPIFERLFHGKGNDP